MDLLASPVSQGPGLLGEGTMPLVRRTGHSIYFFGTLSISHLRGRGSRIVLFAALSKRHEPLYSEDCGFDLIITSSEIRSLTLF